jgi:hypothetical protein
LRSRAEAKRLHDAAFSLGVPAELAEYLPQLFRGVRAFGSDPGLIVRLLKQAEIGRESFIADLACGKGPVAMDTAAELGCRAVGVDVCEAFVAEARRTAARRGLARRVTFECTRIPSWRPGRRFDAVVIIGLGPMSISALTLRRLVLPGGVLVADDVVHAPAGRRLTWSRSPIAREAARVERYGYTVEHVELPEPDEVRASNERLHARLTLNAERLRRRRPELGRGIDEFLDYLAGSAQYIPSPNRPAIWMLRRTR